MKHNSDSQTQPHAPSAHGHTKPDIDSAYAAGFRDGAEQVRMALEAVRNTLVSFARRSKDTRSANVTAIRPAANDTCAQQRHKRRAEQGDAQRSSDHE